VHRNTPRREDGRLSLQSRELSRETYIGPWLPEPLIGDASLLDRFVQAVTTHDKSAVLSLLANEASWMSDGGGKAKAARRIIHGRERVARFVLAVLGRRTNEFVFTPIRINQRLYSLDAWQEAPYYRDCERAALEWTEAVTTLSNGHAPDSVYEKLRVHFREDEIAALTLSIAMINAWNRLNVAFRTEAGGYRPGMFNDLHTA
jgi:hypothetical protein